MHPVLETLADKKHVIWDWNGTLLNDVSLCVSVISELLQEHGKAPLTVDEYRTHFGFPVIRYYERLGFDFGRAPFETIATEFVTRYNARVHACGLFEGASEVLDSIAASGRDQSILSAAKQSDLHAQTSTLGIAPHFKHRYGIQDHYAAGKIARGRELLHTLDLAAKDLILIGDTEHDAEVAAALGIDAVLLTGGHHPFPRLHATGATVLNFRI